MVSPPLPMGKVQIVLLYKQYQAPEGYGAQTIPTILFIYFPVPQNRMSHLDFTVSRCYKAGAD
ncbi:unnamed protein product [Staurois parvus]|uniref:Uncharacterized protein n=1 Tax=Staurois parvus TaxID=386267 RepID=A0ABN9H532_9NEOB|nr:unnamed protein product [Staurois parvus]